MIQNHHNLAPENRPPDRAGEAPRDFWGMIEHFRQIGEVRLIGPAASAVDIAPGEVGERVADAPAAAPAPSLRLEPLGNNLTKDTSLGTIISGCSCRVRTCEKCGPRQGWEVRQNLLSKQDFWRKPGLLTLTVDRGRFLTAKAAHAAVTKGFFIPRLMRLLGVRRWLWALEFQQKTGEGWPHWHLLIDLADLPEGKIDLRKAWKLWRGKWNLGGLDLTEKKVKLQSAEHAVFYITKYLTKMPTGGFPVWVLQQAGMRFVQGCKKLGPIVGTGKPRVAAAVDDPEKKPRAARRPLLDRMAGCRGNSRAYHVRIDSQGEVRYRFVSSLPIGCRALPLLQQIDPQRFPGQVEEREFLGKTALYYTGDAQKLREYLTGNPKLGDRQVEEQESREEILRANRFAQRAILEGQQWPGVVRWIAFDFWATPHRSKNSTASAA